MHRSSSQTPYRNLSQDCASTQNQRHLTQRELADRWNKSEATIERYRSDDIGPRFLKIGGAVRYRLEDIEAFEQECLYENPHTRCAALAAKPSSVTAQGAMA